MVAPYTTIKAILAGCGGTAGIMPVPNPLERVNGKVKRRTEVVGIFPKEAAITPLVSAILLEQLRRSPRHRRGRSCSA